MAYYNILDFDINTKFNINFQLNGNEYDFNTKIINKTSDFIILEPIKMKEVLLDFSKIKLLVNLISFRKGDKPVIWRGCQLELTKFKGKIGYKVNVFTLGEEINRRRNFRIPIDMEGSLIADGNYFNIIYLKDISLTGIGFESNMFIDKNKKYRIIFKDELLGYSFDLGIKIIREKLIENNIYFYGCQFTKNNESFQKYISEKQVRKCKKIKNNVFSYDELNTVINIKT
jgi:hypothetical protein